MFNLDKFIADSVFLDRLFFAPNIEANKEDLIRDIIDVR
jgi:hypothetical protein